jgi:signal peptidase II
LVQSVTRWLGLAAFVWLLDRASKVFVAHALALGEEVKVLPVFSWIRLHNQGAAFSVLDDAGGWQRWLFVALALGFAAYLLNELRRLPAREHLLGCAYSLVLGGALGNMWDRMFDGHVVDFVLIHWANHYFPAFNVADSAISVGAALWILAMLRDSRRQRRAGA